MPEAANYRFSIWNLLGITTGCAAILGMGRLLGPELSWSFFLAAYAFAPALAMLTLFLMRRREIRIRYGVAAVTLLVLLATMMILCGIYYGREAVLYVLVGTFIEWPGQIGVLVCLRLVWKAERQQRLANG